MLYVAKDRKQSSTGWLFYYGSQGADGLDCGVALDMWEPYEKSIQAPAQAKRKWFLTSFTLPST